ncbi:ASCH domain-containing protein [Haladaptatus pallidirubidus]|uniref:ASCH domain-containing protein n=1 Tax=Haladaptatus pallidirubidus TaxID=1008152 RepID=A0AAV3UMK8_9EURY|nr:ASCH domain-containing protein [Haladaptatus pallidirubidus]
MAEIDADAVLPAEHIRQAVASGRVSQLHRGDQYADEGDTFDIDDETFEVVEVTERKLGDLTDEDAQAEGSADLDAYRERLNRAHDHFEWDDDATVYRHRFEPRE